MPDIGSLQPRSVITDAQRRREQIDAASRRDFDTAMFGAIDQTIPAYLVRQFSLGGYQPDPNFNLDAKLVNELAEGIDPALVPQFGDAVSMDHAMRIRADLLMLSDHRQALADLGWQGQALSLGSTLIDPAMLAVGVLSGGVGTAAAASSTASRLAQLSIRGFVTGAAFAGIESYKASQNPSIDGADVAAAGLAGFGMSFFGGLPTGRLTQALAAGAGGSIPVAALEATLNQFREEDQRRAVLWNGATNFILGTALSLVGPHGKQPNDPVEIAGRRMQRDAEHEALRAAGGKPTAKGEKYFAEQLADRGERVAPIVKSAVDEEFAAAEAELGAFIAKQEAQRAADIARTPLDKGGGVGFLPPIVHPNQARGYIAESPHARLSFEDARRDANAARRASPDTRVVVVEYPGGAFAAFREWKAGEQRGTGPDIPVPGPAAVVTPETLRGAAGSERPLERRGGLQGSPPPPSETPAEPPLSVSQTVSGTGNQPAAEATPPPAATSGPAGPAMGAASATAMYRAPRLDTLTEWDDFDASGITDARPLYPMVRADMPGNVGDSEVPSHRLAANVFGKDPLPKADGTPSFYSAPEASADWTAAIRGELLARMDAIYGAYRKAGGKLSRQDFNVEATKAQRRIGTPAATTDPHLTQAAALGSELTEKVGSRASRHAVPGFEKFKHRPNHVGRLYNRDKMDEVAQRTDPSGTGYVGHEQLRELFRGAILRGTRGFTPPEADVLAKAIIANGGKKIRSELDRGLMFRSNPEALREAAKLVSPQTTDAEINQIIAKLRPNDETGVPSRGKSRIDMDETFYIDTPDHGRLAVEDLLENDIESLITRYAHQLNGAAAFAEGARQFVRGPDDQILTIDTLIERLKKDAEDLGVKGFESDLAKLKVMMQITAGIPLGEDTATSRALRTIQNLNFVRYMSNVGTGAQNFGEIVHGLSEAGLRAATNQMPALTEIFKRGADGRMTNELARECEMMGLGLERMNHRITPRTAQEDGVLSATGKFETWSAKAARWAGDISLQSWGQVALSRLNFDFHAQRWLDIALSGKYPSRKRLAGIGLSEDMARRITAAMRDPQHGATVEPGVTGARIIRANMEHWTDVEAAMAFRNAMSKYVRRVSLNTNATELAKWMTTDMGRLFVQLRKFVFAAWTNKLLYEVHMRDTIAARSFVLSLVGAGLIYVARTYVDSVGKPNGDKWRRDRLTPAKIGEAAFGRSAFSSFLPGIVDTAADLSGRPQVFGHARTSGLSGSFIFGNPTADWARSAYQLPSAIIGPLWEDYDFSRQDVSNLTNGLWIPNVVGVRNIIDQLSRRLPKQSRKQQ